MIVFLTLAYVAVLFVLVKMKVLPNTKATWLSTIVWMVVLLIFLFIPMQWGAPSGPIKVLTRATQIVPNVAGQVIEVAAKPNVPLEEGEVLFRLDPEPFEIAARQAEATLARVEAQVRQDQDALASAQAQLRQALAQRDLAKLRFEDDSRLAVSGTISQSRLESTEASLEAAEGAVDQARSAVSRAEVEISALTDDGEVAKLAEARASLNQAEWNLEQTIIRAPSEGYLTNLAITEGQRVVTFPFAPAGVFVDTAEKVVIAEVHQIYLRHIEVGQPVEVAFKTMPGVLITGTVETVLDIASQGQAQVTGTVYQAGQIASEPFIVRIVLDDPNILDEIPPGAAGIAAIYTESASATHVIRKVIIRMNSILNYIRPDI
ncbi:MULTISPECIES: HlyD family secretion protein [Ruegeria]|uniref:HlyD family secretion protein n=2 Tax=Roseobacteraceae TaxID=2854170 RepID=UPI0014803EB4|nr:MULTISPECIES: biotin/lipoyl-binding protein [Ruegeria]NOD52516.1 biotin/lipoyl-binding protein [Ruegeria sp. HKCCD5851]